MRHTLLLSCRYLAHHRVRTLIVILCIAITFFLPLAVWLLIDHFEDTMLRRAKDVPVVVGPKGDRFELMLRSVYFRGGGGSSLTLADLTVIRGRDRGEAIPILAGHTAQGVPIVGTSPEYFDRLGLRAERGTLPLRIGDAVLGANVPARLKQFDGRQLGSDVNPHQPTELSLRMNISGVLARRDSPDDDVILVDLKTAWVLFGIGHGHVEGSGAVDPDTVLNREDGDVVFNPALFKAQAITPENLESFHFHGDRSGFPLSAILVWPESRKDRDILLGYYLPKVHKTAQALEPEGVLVELLGLLFRVKRFFDANVITVAISTSLFLALIVLLSLRIRKREMETLFRIGCSRTKVFWMQATELVILVFGGLLLAAAFSAGAYWYMVQSRFLL